MPSQSILCLRHVGRKLTAKEPETALGERQIIMPVGADAAGFKAERRVAQMRQTKPLDADVGGLRLHMLAVHRRREALMPEQSIGCCRAVAREDLERLLDLQALGQPVPQVHRDSACILILIAP